MKTSKKTNFKENVRHELLQFFAHLVISYQKAKENAWRDSIFREKH